MSEPLTARDETFDKAAHLRLNPEIVGAALLAHDWRFARTMPQYPHWYTLRKNWTGPMPWENVVQFLRDDGRRGRFNGRRNTYWTFQGMRYWSMGAPLGITILINRDHDRPAPYFCWE